MHAGALTVQSLNIGVWGISTDKSGNFEFAPVAGSGFVVIASDVETSNTLTANTITTKGSSSFFNVSASGALTADALTAKYDYSLCNSSGTCLSQYPQFQSLQATFVNNTMVCPPGWTAIGATIFCNHNTYIDNQLLPCPTESNAVPVPPSACDIVGDWGFLGCAIAGQV